MRFPGASQFIQNLTGIAQLTPKWTLAHFRKIVNLRRFRTINRDPLYLGNALGPGGDGSKNAPYKNSINAFEGLIHDRCLYDRCVYRGICNIELARKRQSGLSAG